MIKITRESNVFVDVLMLPGLTWLIVLRKNIGSRFIGQSYINAVILPIAAVFAPFPFTGQFVWEGSKMTLIYAVIAMVRGVYEFMKAKIGKGRVNIHSDSTGQPLNFWYRVKLFKNPVAIRRYGEPSLAALIGFLFYYTGWDTFFGWLMIYTGFVCLCVQWEFDVAYAKEKSEIVNTKVEAGDAQQMEKEVSEEMKTTTKRTTTVDICFLEVD